MSATDPSLDDTPPTPRMRPVRKTRSFATVRAITALILREMATTYGRSPGGYVWAILQPALGIAFLTAVFSAGFRTPGLGTNFAIFYATGLVPFMMYLDISNKVGTAISYSRQLLGYPGVTFIDALIARFLLSTLTQLLISYLLISFIRTVYKTQTVVEFDTVVLGYSMVILLGAGVGTLNGFLFLRWPVYQQFWSIATRPLVFFSGVIFLYDTHPQMIKDWLWWNPLVHVVGTIRSGFYVRYDALYASPLYVFIFASVAFVVGLLFLYRYHRELLEM